MADRLLAIDTATAACSVALFEDGQLVASDYKEIGRGHAEKLVPMIADLPDQGRAQEILVNCGPGSFTGVRIGISAAKALALAWEAEVTGYQCLHLIAAQAAMLLETPQPVFVAMNGGHGEYFVQNFTASGDPSDDLQSLAATPAVEKNSTDIVVGTGAVVITEQGSRHMETLTIYPNAEMCMQLSPQHRNLTTKPIYGRAPDAVAQATQK